MNNQLYQKMLAEQKEFRDSLLRQSPEEILNHAVEYSTREDIVMEMEELDLSTERVSALLQSRTPLADVYKEFSNTETPHMDTIRDCIENRADYVLRQEKEARDALRNTPLYKYPGTYARENGELDTYRASYRANIACKEAIEKAINEHYADNRLGDGAVKQVADAFGYERMLYVLANTIRQKDWDERFSAGNKHWAQTIPIFENPDSFGYDRNRSFVVDRAHPGLTNLFTSQARHEYLLSLPLTKEDIKAEAISILSRLQNAKEPNSPSGTHFVAQVSPDFAARAGNKEMERLQKLLPFDSLSLCSLEGRKGIFAVISADENRFQKLRQRKPSIRAQLAVKPAPGKRTKAKVKEQEAR